MRKLLLLLSFTGILYISCTSLPQKVDSVLSDLPEVSEENENIESEILNGDKTFGSRDKDEIIPNLGNRNLVLASFFDDLICTWNEKDLAAIRGLSEWIVTPLNSESIVLQLGVIEGNEENTETGFILYDDSNKGHIVSYRRRGIEKEWSWEDYRCVLRTDDTILYYDFSGLDDHEKTKPKEILKAKKIYKNN